MPVGGPCQQQSQDGSRIPLAQILHAWDQWVEGEPGRTQPGLPPSPTRLGPLLHNSIQNWANTDLAPGQLEYFTAGLQEKGLQQTPADSPYAYTLKQLWQQAGLLKTWFLWLAQQISS